MFSTLISSACFFLSGLYNGKSRRFDRKVSKIITNNKESLNSLISAGIVTQEAPPEPEPQPTRPKAKEKPSLKSKGPKKVPLKKTQPENEEEDEETALFSPKNSRKYSKNAKKLFTSFISLFGSKKKFQIECPTDLMRAIIICSLENLKKNPQFSSYLIHDVEESEN